MTEKKKATIDSPGNWVHALDYGFVAGRSERRWPEVKESYLDAINAHHLCHWTAGSRELLRDVLLWIAGGQKGECPVDAHLADVIGSVLAGEDWDLTA